MAFEGKRYDTRENIAIAACTPAAPHVVGSIVL